MIHEVQVAPSAADTSTTHEATQCSSEEVLTAVRATLEVMFSGHDDVTIEEFCAELGLRHARALAAGIGAVQAALAHMQGRNEILLGGGRIHLI